MKTFYKTIVVVFLVNLFSLKGYSTLIIPPDNMNEMISSCDNIVYGQVVGHADRYGSINQFKIIKSFKGKLRESDVIQLKEEGLRTEESILKISGDVNFKLGSHYLLFLFQDGSGYYRPQLLSLSVYEEIMVNGFNQFMHTESVLDICFLDDVDDSLTGSYNSQDMLRSLGESVSAWNFKTAGFRGEIPEKNKTENFTGKHHKSTVCTPPPSHCTTLIGEPSNLNGNCNTMGNVSPAKYQSTNFLIKVASGAQSDPSTPNEMSNLADAVGELNNLDGLTLALGSPAIQNCSTNTQSSAAQLVQVVCNPFSANEIWVFFDDPYSEIADLTACNGVVGKGGTRATTPCHTDACGNQWLTAEQPYFVMNNGSGCLGDYGYTATIIHEMMHGLNLDHINGSCSAIMNGGLCGANDPSNPNGDPPAPNFGITQLDKDCIEWMYNQCPDNENLNNIVYNSSTPVNVIVQDWITSANITVNGNANVRYDAGDFVELNPLFEVKLGAIFNALIAGCTP